MATEKRNHIDEANEMGVLSAQDVMKWIGCKDDKCDEETPCSRCQEVEGEIIDHVVLAHARGYERRKEDAAENIKGLVEAAKSAKYLLEKCGQRDAPACAEGLGRCLAPFKKGEEKNEQIN